jgi:hypothetical protein
MRLLAPGFIIPLAVWSLLWTGLALWNSAKRQQQWWFIFFLLVHTAGIVEIIYLVFVIKLFSAPKPKKVSQSTRKR